MLSNIFGTPFKRVIGYAEQGLLHTHLGALNNSEFEGWSSHADCPMLQGFQLPSFGSAGFSTTRKRNERCIACFFLA